MRKDLPSGTATFIFTDVEGSTKLLHELGAEAYASTLAEHRQVIREACTAEGGAEVDTQGDARCLATSLRHRHVPLRGTRRTTTASCLRDIRSAEIVVRWSLK